MKLSDFDYDLPAELIAQAPPAERDAARMLVVDRATGTFSDRSFRDFPQYLRTGDCVVLNDSRVLASRLIGTRAGGGAAELLLLEPVSTDARDWRALVRPGRKLRVGSQIHFGDGISAAIVEHGERGERVVRFDGDVYAAMEEIGRMPLPPYIRREAVLSDKERYQTVYARERGSIAAPTAGLHFTDVVLDACRAQGAKVERVTLHVGLGTFQPMEREDYENHELHFERYAIAPDAWREIEQAQRVVAVGTTSVRTVESAARRGQLTGSTNLFLKPGDSFARVGAMLTNFHLPRTSLLLLVSAFAGADLILAAYRHAVEQRYRFFSYGDCMLIL